LDGSFHGLISGKRAVGTKRGVTQGKGIIRKSKRGGESVAHQVPGKQEKLQRPV